MKIAWAILIITAFTDFIIGFAGALTTATAATHVAELPNKGAMFFAAMFGLVAAARTIQQGLKTVVANTAVMAIGTGDGTVKI